MTDDTEFPVEDIQDAVDTRIGGHKRFALNVAKGNVGVQFREGAVAAVIEQHLASSRSSTQKGAQPFQNRLAGGLGAGAILLRGQEQNVRWRHPERFGTVARLCRRRGLRVALRSRTSRALPTNTDVLVGDTMGELQRLYAAADVAFIGGSLVAHGGQNLLEACAVRVPVIFGPHMFHFEEISALALERGAARQVHSVAELVEAVALYFEQPALREAAGRAAHSVVAENRGALSTVRSRVMMMPIGSSSLLAR